MTSYDGATLKVTELFSTALSIANVCLWRLHGCVLDFIHLSAMDVAEIAKSTNEKGVSVYFWPCSVSKILFTYVTEGEGGYVFTPFCLFVCRISQKVVDWFGV